MLIIKSGPGSIIGMCPSSAVLSYSLWDPRARSLSSICSCGLVRKHSVHSGHLFGQCTHSICTLWIIRTSSHTPSRAIVILRLPENYYSRQKRLRKRIEKEKLDLPTEKRHLLTKTEVQQRVTANLRLCSRRRSICAVNLSLLILMLREKGAKKRGKS